MTADPPHGLIWSSEESMDAAIARNREYFVDGVITISEFESRVDEILRNWERP